MNKPVPFQTFVGLAERISSVKPFGNSRWLAVDGPAGAGKSSFAQKISEALGRAAIIPMDDFLAWDDLTDFWTRLEKEVIAPLGKGHSANYQARDWERDKMGRSLGSFKTIPLSPYYILEGVGSARRQMKDRLGFTVWIDTPGQTCLERGLARDGAEMRGAWEKWQDKENAFFREDGARERADLVVDGTKKYKEGFWILGGV